MKDIVGHFEFKGSRYSSLTADMAWMIYTPKKFNFNIAFNIYAFAQVKTIWIDTNYSNVVVMCHVS